MEYTKKLMTLDEAIEHATEKSQGCGQCAAEHKQLAEWLKELKELRNKKDSHEYIRHMASMRMPP